ncbi:MAG: amidohydrolase family protein [Caldilineaceae bacterium]|nr:amidohydrolase family protein [Caldilineaceae bacterium]
MILDTHTHFYDPNRPQGVPWPPKDNTLLYRPVLPGHLKDLAAPLGVTGTVVVEASSWLEDNQWILDLAADDPFIVGLVGNIVPNRPEFGAELARFVANPLFRGIRCGGQRFAQIEQGSFLADLKTLADHNLALDVLIQADHLDAVLDVARRIPDLRIVINHILHMPVDGNPISPGWQDRYQRAAELPNVYMKLSAMMEQSTVTPAPAALDFYRPTLDVLWRTFGADKLIYGSNWPVSDRSGRSYADYLNVVQAYFAEKGEEALERYLWRNAVDVYGVKMG